MRAKDLITELQKLAPETEIVLSGDPEGNYFWKIQVVDTEDSKYGVIWPGASIDEEVIYPEVAE